MESKFRLTMASARSGLKLLASIALYFLYLVSFGGLGNLVETISYNTTLWSEKEPAQRGVLTKASLSKVDYEIQSVLMLMCCKLDVVNQPKTIKQFCKELSVTAAGIIDFDVEVTSE